MGPFHHRRLTPSFLKKPARGFTLIEMLIVLAIIVIITTIALTGQSLFNRSLILINTSYDVALSIHQAEVFGVSSRAFGATQDTGYGVEFTKASNRTYVMYADAYPLPGAATNCHCSNAACAALPDAKPGNCLYDAVYGAGQSELVQQYTLGADITVADFCGTDTTPSQSKHCANGAPSDLTKVDIVYVRPDAQATIIGVKATGVQIPLSQVTLYLAADGGQHCLQATAIGQVSVLAACP